MLTATVAASHVLLPVLTARIERPYSDKSSHNGYNPARCLGEYKPVDMSTKPVRLSLAHPAGLGTRLSKRKSHVVCAAAMNAKCSSSQGQTATITQKSPTITQAPVHEKSPKLDDGDGGFPPGDDGGGGGGGGGGGNWSGGFFLFGFLAFLGFLKDRESEEDYRDRRDR